MSVKRAGSAGAQGLQPSPEEEKHQTRGKIPRPTVWYWLSDHRIELLAQSQRQKDRATRAQVRYRAEQ
jgi:hypothetical protein